MPSGDAVLRTSRVAPLRTMITIVAGYLALTAWWLWPCRPGWRTTPIYQSGTPFIAADVHLITWALAWDARAPDPSAVALRRERLPSGAVVAGVSEHFFGYVPLFAPAYLLTGNPVLAAERGDRAVVPALRARGVRARAALRDAAVAAFVAGALFAFHGERYLNLYPPAPARHVVDPARAAVHRALARARPARDAVAPRCRRRDAAPELVLLSRTRSCCSTRRTWWSLVWRRGAEPPPAARPRAGARIGGVPAALASAVPVAVRLGLHGEGGVRWWLVLTSFLTMGRIRF